MNANAPPALRKYATTSTINTRFRRERKDAIHSLEQATGRFHILPGHLRISGGEHPKCKVELDRGITAIDIDPYKDCSGRLTLRNKNTKTTFVRSEHTKKTKVKIPPRKTLR